ncbi:MAG: RICIN domain-containing protein, partial [Saccharofermentanales bacterium]
INVDISNASLNRQLWSIQSNGNGSYRILSECSNLSKGLTVEGASTASPANVFQYAYTGAGSNDNDDWIFELISNDFVSREQPIANSNLNNKIIESSADYNNMPLSEKVVRYVELCGIYDEAFAIAIGGMLANLDMASAMLVHYLANDGTAYNIPYNRLIIESTYACNNHIDAINVSRNIAGIFEQEGYSQFCNLAEKPYNDNHPNLNWQYSVGKYYMWTLTDILSSSTLRSKFYLRDFYDWNKDDYDLYPLPISQHSLWLLHYAGMAQQYYVYGDITQDIDR